MRKYCGIAALLVLLFLLTACSTSVPEPPEYPEITAEEITQPEIDLQPSPLILDNEHYTFEQGTVCLKTSESYGNVGEYFPMKFGLFFERMLKGLGYEVVTSSSASPDCEIVIGVTFDINLLSSYYQLDLAPAGRECYTGIDVFDEIEISLPNEAVQSTFSFEGSKEIPYSIDFDSGCYGLEDNPLVKLWKYNFVELVEDVWGYNGLAAVLSVAGPEDMLGDLKEKAWGILNQNKDQLASSVEVENLVNAYQGVGFFHSAVLQTLVDYYDVSEVKDILAPVVIEIMSDEIGTTSDPPQSLIRKSAPYRELMALAAMELDASYVNTASPIIFELALIYTEQDDHTSRVTDTMREFRDYAAEALASMGPDVIPVMLGYMTQNPDDSALQNLAARVLGQLAQNGYKEEVAELAGHHLSYLLYRMESGEVYDEKVVRSVLRNLFPDAITDSNTKAVRFYRAWRKAYGN